MIRTNHRTKPITTKCPTLHRIRSTIRNVQTTTIHHSNRHHRMVRPRSNQSSSTIVANNRRKNIRNSPNKTTITISRQIRFTSRRRLMRHLPRKPVRLLSFLPTNPRHTKRRFKNSRLNNSNTITSILPLTKRLNQIDNRRSNIAFPRHIRRLINNHQRSPRTNNNNSFMNTRSIINILKPTRISIIRRGPFNFLSHRLNTLSRIKRMHLRRQSHLNMTKRNIKPFSQHLINRLNNRVPRRHSPLPIMHFPTLNNLRHPQQNISNISLNTHYNRRHLSTNSGHTQDTTNRFTSRNISPINPNNINRLSSLIIRLHSNRFTGPPIQPTKVVNKIISRNTNQKYRMSIIPSQSIIFIVTTNRIKTGNRTKRLRQITTNIASIRLSIKERTNRHINMTSSNTKRSLNRGNTPLTNSSLFKNTENIITMRTNDGTLRPTIKNTALGLNPTRINTNRSNRHIPFLRGPDRQYSNCTRAVPQILQVIEGRSKLRNHSPRRSSN